jgi:hypothetical protein
MLTTHTVTGGLKTLLYLGTIPLIGALAISVKLAYLIPLLIKWNTQHPFPNPSEIVALEQSHPTSNRNSNSSK